MFDSEQTYDDSNKVTLTTSNSTLNSDFTLNTPKLSLFLLPFPLNRLNFDSK